MKLYAAAIPVIILILIGAAATIMISRKPVPEEFRYDFEKVYRLYDEKKYNEAVATYEGLLDKYKVESPDLYYNLANAHFKAEQIGPAVFYYKKALKVKSDLATSYFSVGDIFFSLKDYHSAAVMYGKGLKYSPEDKESRQKKRG